MAKIVPIKTFKNDVALAVDDLNQKYKDGEVHMLMMMSWPKVGQPSLWTVGSSNVAPMNLLEAIGLLEAEKARLLDIYQRCIEAASDDEYDNSPGTTD